MGTTIADACSWKPVSVRWSNGSAPISVPAEVAQPPPVVLAFEREPAVLDARIERLHLVDDVGDVDARPEESGRKHDVAIRQADLRVVGRLRAGLLLPVFVAARVMDAEAGGHSVVALEVPEAAGRAELAGGGHPHQRARNRAHVVPELPRIYAELAQIVAPHHAVAQPLGDFAPCKEAGGVRRPEELIRDQALVRPEPVRPLPLRAPGARQAC